MTVTDPSAEYIQDCADSIYLTAIQFNADQLRIYPRAGNGDGHLIRKLFKINDRAFVEHRGFWVVTNLKAYQHVKCVQVAGEAFGKQLPLPEVSCETSKQ